MDINAEVLQWIRDYREFKQECEESEYTDTGAAWFLLDEGFLILSCVLADRLSEGKNDD